MVLEKGFAWRESPVGPSGQTPRKAVKTAKGRKKVIAWLVTALNHGIREIELPIEFQRARVDGQRAGCRTRLSSFVDDAWLEAQLTQPESEDETGRAGPDDQNIAASHTAPRWGNLLHLTYTAALVAPKVT